MLAEQTPQAKHKKSSFSKDEGANTAREEKKPVPPAPIANNFVLEEGSATDSQSKVSANFPDFELKEKEKVMNQKSTFSAAPASHGSVEVEAEAEPQVELPEVISQK